MCKDYFQSISKVDFDACNGADTKSGAVYGIQVTHETPILQFCLIF